jgi:hypothetical protein
MSPVAAPTVASYPPSIVVLLAAALGVGFAGLVSPGFILAPSFRTMVAERGLPVGLIAFCGFTCGLAGLVAGVGLISKADWGRRLLVGVAAVLPFLLLAALPMGWFVAALVLTTIVVVLSEGEQARAYFANAATAPNSAAGSAWGRVGGWRAAGAYGGLVVTAGVLRVVYNPAPVEPPKFAWNEPPAERSSSPIQSPPIKPPPIEPTGQPPSAKPVEQLTTAETRLPERMLPPRPSLPPLDGNLGIDAHAVGVGRRFLLRNGAGPRASGRN